MSGGKRAGSGRKKTNPGPTCKEKKLAKAALAEAAAAAGYHRDGEEVERQRAAAACAPDVFVHNGPQGFEEHTWYPHLQRNHVPSYKPPSTRVANAVAADTAIAAAAAEAASEAAKKNTLHSFFKPLLKPT